MLKKVGLMLSAMVLSAMVPAYAAFYDNSPRYEKIMAAPHDTMYLDMDSVRGNNKAYNITCGVLTIFDGDKNVKVRTNITFYYDVKARTAQYTIDSFDELNDKGEVVRTEKTKGADAEKKDVEEGTNMYSLANAIYYIVMGDTFYPDDNLTKGKAEFKKVARDNINAAQAMDAGVVN